MPVFSRLGAYDRALVDDAAWAHTARRPRLLVEYWAHEASLVPVADWPLLLSGAKRRGWWKHYAALVEQEPAIVEDVLAAVKELGPVGAGGLEKALGAASVPRPSGVGWWERSQVKRVCEWMFGMGLLTTGTRVHFQRLYDLPERVLPPEVLAAPAPSPEEAARRLVGQAATALGVATEPDLRDYYRLGPEASRQAVAELVEAGELEPIAVRGWRAPAYRVPGARMPRRITGRALLCPFDPLIWERARTERIFGFRYRIEIYMPEPKREYGYYVFPFLLDGELVARVDLKADRAAGVLRVQGAFAEPAADRARVAAELAAELRRDGRVARALRRARRGPGGHGRPPRGGHVLAGVPSPAPSATTAGRGARPWSAPGRVRRARSRGSPARRRCRCGRARAAPRRRPGARSPP